ncbi:hypothetical protein EDF35_0172 [Rathayibacter sp. PhB151]|nr:hypothetical protein EDF35_0172 [Rathayibacter sp. PhB151]
MRWWVSIRPSGATRPARGESTHGLHADRVARAASVSRSTRVRTSVCRPAVLTTVGLDTPLRGCSTSREGVGARWALTRVGGPTPPALLPAAGLSARLGGGGRGRSGTLPPSVPQLEGERRDRHDEEHGGGAQRHDPERARRCDDRRGVEGDPDEAVETEHDEDDEVGTGSHDSHCRPRSRLLAVAIFIPVCLAPTQTGGAGGACRAPPVAHSSDRRAGRRVALDRRELRSVTIRVWLTTHDRSAPTETRRAPPIPATAARERRSRLRPVPPTPTRERPRWIDAESPGPSSSG